MKGKDVSEEVLSSATENKSTSVYNKLKTDIINNKYPPGTLMVERKLCEIYNVSRSPVRQAISMLSAEGILDMKPGKGMVVPEYSLEDILEIYDLLEVLQIYALQVSFNNYTEFQDEQFKKINDEARKQLKKSDMEGRMVWDIKLHEAIIEMASNRYLDMIFQMLISHKKRFEAASYDDLAHGEITTKQHEDIHAAIAARDLDGAIAAIKAHYEYIKKYYINLLINKKHNISFEL